MFKNTPIVTILVVVIAAVASVAGAVVTITNPDTLSFAEYLDKIALFLGGLGLLAVGRGINSGLQNRLPDGTGPIVTPPIDGVEDELAGDPNLPNKP